MKKKFFSTLSLLLMAVCAWAVPAKPGIWKTLPLNGVGVKAQLMGDEHMHYWLTEDGRSLTEKDGRFVLADMDNLRRVALSRRQAATNRHQRRARHNAIGDFTHYEGQKKGLIILVEFSNMQFMAANDSLRYTRICNETGYNEGSFRGSVNDYFKAQSYGKFDLTFDVIGPVQMPNNYEYYGQDIPGQEEGYDMRPGLMVASACQAVDSLVNFNDYDWDGDGEVDQVMCIYAGAGQASGGSSSTIWPHEWQLEESDFGQKLELDSVSINTYAVANERIYGSIDGIGTICHEFSHCLGLPDMYDISYKGNFGMGCWSLMDRGSYNGNSFCPSGYTSFDKLTCGWVNPVVLTNDITIDAMKPLEDEPEVYLIPNDAYEDEYYLLENRQQKGWDEALPGSGMLILYVDYDKEIWENNLVNTDNSGHDGTPANNHQRCTIFHANNNDWGYGSSGDAYPYLGNDSLTNTSLPAAKLYHDNLDGGRLMNKGILDITRHADGTMAFRFRNSPFEVYIPEGTVLYEMFNNCNGKGGNDGLWNVSIASGLFQPDNEGWTTQKPYAGYHCARFGNVLTAGKATTPPFETETGAALLTFKAAGWNTDGTTLALSIEGEGDVKPQEVTMEPFTWNEYTVLVRGNGTVRVTFTPEKRFLLDDVLAVQVQNDNPYVPDIPNGITDVERSTSNVQRSYDLQGRRVDKPTKGLYIVYDANSPQGRKVLLRK